MRVSFVLNADQNIGQVMEDRIRILEHNFDMEVQGFAIKQISKADFDFNYKSVSPEEVKHALANWECELQFEIQFEFKELGRDE